MLTVACLKKSIPKSSNFSLFALVALVVALVVVRNEHVLSSPATMILYHEQISMKGTYGTRLIVL